MFPWNTQSPQLRFYFKIYNNFTLPSPLVLNTDAYITGAYILKYSDQNYRLTTILVNT